ncbi:MAG: response regulator [Bacteriovoracaceae bacterium]|nr:response regulator [Bacteriovoracaceae bacterium]
METERTGEYLIFDEVKIPKDIQFLIVEDEEDILELTKDSLIELGFSGQVTAVKSVESAIELSLQNEYCFDFIISDWNLTDLSGLDLLINLRNDLRYKNTPFLMVTANDNISGMIVANKKGVSDYLVKPWTLEELQMKIADCWSKKLPTLPV